MEHSIYFEFPKKIEAIQALRFILALIVAFCHFSFLKSAFFTNTPYDFGFSISAFFAISSFIMMLSTRKKKKKFLVRRLIRLLPLYWILTIGTFVIAKIYPAIIGYSPTIEQLFKSMFCIPFARSALKADTAVRPIIGLGHTLEFEVVFCIIFAIAMLISHKYRGVIALGIMAVFTLSSYLFDFENVVLNFYLSNRWLAFMVGILCYYLMEYFQKIKLSLKTYYPMVIIALVTALSLTLAQVFISFLRQTDTTYYVQLFLCGLLLTLAVFYSCYGFPVPRWTVKLGDISYSFYLIHYYVISVTERFFHMETVSVVNLLIALAAIVLSWGLSYISWWLIENKLTAYLNSLLCRREKVAKA